MLISLSNIRLLFSCLVYCFLSCVQVESLLPFWFVVLAFCAEVSGQFHSAEVSLSGCVGSRNYLGTEGKKSSLSPIWNLTPIPRLSSPWSSNCTDSDILNPCVWNSGDHVKTTFYWQLISSQLAARVLLDMLIVAQRAKKFQASYRTWRFISVLTRARHLTYPEPAESIY
jgi:hypothetical protein